MKAWRKPRLRSCMVTVATLTARNRSRVSSASGLSDVVGMRLPCLLRRSTGMTRIGRPSGADHIAELLFNGTLDRYEPEHLLERMSVET